MKQKLNHRLIITGLLKSKTKNKYSKQQKKKKKKEKERCITIKEARMRLIVDFSAEMIEAHIK